MEKKQKAAMLIDAENIPVLYVEEIKRFQDNFSESYSEVIRPESFQVTLKASIDTKSNLITSNHYYPAKTIVSLAESHPGEVQQALNTLLYGEEDILSRIKQYITAIKALNRDDNFTPNSDGDDLRFISTLLFYAHPEEYVPYKYTEIKEFAEKFDTGIVIKAGKPICILQSKALSDIVIDYLKSESETNLAVKSVLSKYEKKMESSEYYHDTNLRVLAQK